MGQTSIEPRRENLIEQIPSQTRCSKSRSRPAVQLGIGIGGYEGELGILLAPASCAATRSRMICPQVRSSAATRGRRETMRSYPSTDVSPPAGGLTSRRLIIRLENLIQG